MLQHQTQLTGSEGNKYLFHENCRLGSGSFGEVFKGFDQKRLQQVAIKRVHNSTLDRHGEEFIKCLGSEANILQEMGVSTHAITIIDCFRTVTYVYIILEFCDGGDLAQRLKKAKDGRFEESEAVKYMAEIINGVYEMHRLDRAHRDLKLENILLNEGHCKIGDFGFATKQIQADQFVGTPEYMAPEIFGCGDGNTYDKQVDIWALGIMFHEMLFGERPYKGSQMQIVNKIVKERYQTPPSPKVSTEVKEVLECMIEVDPKKRITIQSLKKHSLFNEPNHGSDMLSKSCKSAEEGMQKKISGDCWDLTPDVRYSLTMSLTNDYIHRIYSRLENYRLSCGFFLNFAGSLLIRMKVKENVIPDNIHVFIYYMLKFAYNKFVFLLQCLEKDECPRKLFKPVECEYWQQFVKSDPEEYDQFKDKIRTGANKTKDLFLRFRMKNLRAYLEMSGRSVQELDTIYNAKLDTGCQASFKGKLLQVNSAVQKISQDSKSRLSNEMVEILMDLEFSRLIEENMDDFRLIIDFESYNRDKRMDVHLQNMKKFLKARTW